MIYADDELKSEFAKTTQMLQVVVSIFESSLFPFGREVELINVINDTQVFVGVPKLHKNIMHDLEFQINKQFKRKDGMKTCMVEEPEEYGIFRFYATSLNDLAIPN